MKSRINRRSSNYHRTALSLKQNPDLIASALLAINYSRVRQTHKAQQLIQMDCVAVCFVKSKELWVASNSQNISDEDLSVLFKVLDLDPDINIWIVVNGEKNTMHAEMQLLREILNSQLAKHSKGLFFGVSKPCCEQCAEMLDTYNINYSMWHNSKVINWESPFTDQKGEMMDIEE